MSSSSIASSGWSRRIVSSALMASKRMRPSSRPETSRELGDRGFRGDGCKGRGNVAAHPRVLVLVIEKKREGRNHVSAIAHQDVARTVFLRRRSPRSETSAGTKSKSVSPKSRALLDGLARYRDIRIVQEGDEKLPKTRVRGPG